MARALLFWRSSGALLAAAVTATCTFPDVTLAPDDAGAKGGGGATTTASGGTGTGTLPGGAGGGTLTTSSSTTPSATCPIDEDNDGEVSWQCAGGTDCADEDPNTKPGIMEYSSIPIQGPAAMNTNPFDKNCDGDVETETPVLDCSFLCSNGNVLGYESSVDCGQLGALGHCEGIPCKWKPESPAKSKTQKCR